MKQSRIFSRTLLATAVALTSQQAFAAGFQLNAQSATGLGRAFAGDAVIADNASVMARNPAAMALFDKIEVSLGVNVIDTDISVTDVNYAGVQPLDSASNGSATPVPNIYIVVPINERFAIGGGVYTNFGTSNEFNDDFDNQDLASGIPGGAGLYGGVTNVATINYTVAGSYRINEQWSIGAGLDMVTGAGELTRSAEGVVIPTPDGNLDLDNALKVDASGIGIGFNIGATFELNDRNRFGLAYHYSPEVEASGHVEYLGNDDIGDLILPLPDMLEFSGYHHLNNTNFAVHYSVQWIGWSAFDKLETTDGVDLKEYNWQDGMHYAIGGTYYINPKWEARVGYMYDTSAQDKITSISVPDSDRQWFSVGTSYHFTENNSLDFGFTYLVGEEISVEDVSDTGTLYATTKADAMLYGVQYSHRF